MKLTQIIAYFFNILVAMDFSIIAPLMPPLCKEKGISNIICSLIISSLCISQILGSVNSTTFIQKLGIKKLCLISLIGQSICSFSYSFMVYIDNKFVFIVLAFIVRLFHGFFAAWVNVIALTITSLINEGKELEKAMGYMELAWATGEACGPTIVGIFFDIGGYSFPFIIIGLIDFVAIFLFFQIPKRELTLMTKKTTKIIEERKSSLVDFSFIKTLLYPKCLLLVGSIMIELNTTVFYLATLVNYLNDRFSIPTAKASFFFLASTCGYIICTQMINIITDLFNNFKLIYMGHILAIFGCLLTGPIIFLPQKFYIMIIGIFLQGFVGALINIPVFVELNNFCKGLFPNNTQLQRSLSSSFISFSFNSGNLFEPVLGSWITKNFSFRASAYFAAFCSFSIALLFRHYFYNNIYGVNLVHEESLSLLLENKEPRTSLEEEDK